MNPGGVARTRPGGGAGSPSSREPNEDTFGPGLRDQYTTEVYHRWQLSPRFAITPTLQLLENPALDRELDRTWIFGVRARLAR